jgi:predicted SAM-dependent methyltransferase
MYEKRRAFIDELVRGKKLTGIEIGALDKPLVVRDDLPIGGVIKYADHLSKEGLKVKYRSDQSVDLDSLVGVDLINSTGDFSEALEGELVDYIVASHVVEHVPNPIRWLQMLLANLRPGGFIFLVVPDKRFTFDYQRPVTTFGTMLQSFLSGKNMPSAADVFDHHSSAVLINGAKVWSGLLEAGDLIPLASNVKALSYAKEAHEDSVYHDVHVSIFTPISFFSIIERLIHTELFLAEVSRFKDTEINDIEFFCVFEKT